MGGEETPQVFLGRDRARARRLYRISRIILACLGKGRGGFEMQGGEGGGDERNGWREGQRGGPACYTLFICVQELG